MNQERIKPLLENTKNLSRAEKIVEEEVCGKGLPEVAGINSAQHLK